MQILPPLPEENFGHFSNYINKVNTVELLKGLDDNQEVLLQKILALDEATLNFKYQADKWTIKEVIGHVIDTERVFAYRALRFARKDKTPLAGFEEKDYATHNFLQWYVTEQIEEETLARNILDKLKLIGEDKGGMYLFDRDLGTMSAGARGKSSDGK